MNLENSSKNDLRFLISTRHRDGRYGPQSKDMTLSELIGVFKPDVPSTPVLIFPDLRALAQRMDAQIREHFNNYKNEELAQKYDVLFNTWAQTGSIAVEANRSVRWMKVMDLSMDYILQAQKMMPEPQRFDLIVHSHITEVATKGRMYCEALLFHIIARAGFDPGTLINDITLRGYCQWFKGWIKNYINDHDYERMLFGAIYFKPDFAPVLQKLRGVDEPLPPGTLLHNKLKTYSLSDLRRNNEYGHSYNRPEEYSFSMTIHDYGHDCWNIVFTLRDLLYRIDAIESFLEVLETNGENVSFTRTDETSEIMENYLAQLDNGGTLSLSS